MRITYDRITNNYQSKDEKQFRYFFIDPHVHSSSTTTKHFSWKIWNSQYDNKNYKKKKNQILVLENETRLKIKWIFFPNSFHLNYIIINVCLKHSKYLVFTLCTFTRIFLQFLFLKKLNWIVTQYYHYLQLLYLFFIVKKKAMETMVWIFKYAQWIYKKIRKRNVLIEM